MGAEAGNSLGEDWDGLAEDGPGVTSEEVEFGRSLGIGERPRGMGERRWMGALHNNGVGDEAPGGGEDRALIF